MIRPIELLQQELDNLIMAREKSVKAHEEGKIDNDLHETHINNLTPMIEDYKYVIKIIKQYT